jgi:hypothetical protein
MFQREQLVALLDTELLRIPLPRRWVNRKLRMEGQNVPDLEQMDVN